MRLLVLSLCLLIAGPAVAGPEAAVPDASGMLEKARTAAARLDYNGVFIRQRGNEVSSTRITHRLAGKQSQTRLENLDGEAGETLRADGKATTYLPGRRQIVIEDPEAAPGFPQIVAPDRAQLARDYAIRQFPTDRVAGRPALALALDSRDAYHYSYRFWFDKSSGLLLRAQRVSDKAEVVEQVAFAELRFGSQPASRLRPAVGDTRGWTVRRVDVQPVVLTGWQVRWLPSGFVRVGAVTRTTVSDPQGGTRELAHLLYSDGLAGLSVFIEPWSERRAASPLQLGALNMVGKRHGNFWLTIVGEVPMAAIRRVADSIEFTESSPK